jgi:GT2 family glycosyltransferase
MQSKKMLLVVIPTYNRVHDLLACLKSLLASEIREDQIIIVDNNSQDDTVQAVNKNHPKVKLIVNEENLGATGASNIGFNYALEKGADLILRLDSDTIVADDFLDPLLEAADLDPQIGVLSPKIYFYEPPDEIWYAGADAHPWHFGAINTHRYEKDAPQNSRQCYVDYVWGACMLIKRKVLYETGGFDQDFFVYFEEVDFCKRVQEMGFRLFFIPESHVWHKVGSSVENAWTAYHWNKSKVLLYRKHARNFIHRFALIIFAYVYALISPIIKQQSGNRGPLKHTLRGLWDGLTGKISKR